MEEIQLARIESENLIGVSVVYSIKHNTNLTVFVFAPDVTYSNLSPYSLDEVKVNYFISCKKINK